MNNKQKKEINIVKIRKIDNKYRIIPNNSQIMLKNEEKRDFAANLRTIALKKLFLMVLGQNGARRPY